MEYSDIRCPKCGSPMETKDGLEGMWCTNPDCGEYIKQNPPKDRRYNYDEERLKRLRGVPTNKYSIGSETKGHIELQVPCDASVSEIKSEIDKSVEIMLYMKSQIDLRGLDIYASRRRKESE